MQRAMAKQAAGSSSGRGLEYATPRDGLPSCPTSLNNSTNKGEKHVGVKTS